jgi:hypothetical protein
MSDTVKRLKANKKLENTPCGWCYRPLQLGEDAVLCEPCLGTYHAACWDAKGGCARSDCANAPLRRLDAPAAAAAEELKPGRARCPHCREIIPSGEPICPFCRQIATPDGVYHGPKTVAKDANSALTAGIVGIFLCGLVLGIVAIVYARRASAAIAQDPTLTGEGRATAGLVLGIIDVVGWAIVILLRLP